jgi:arylsulfatase A-like enzyme
MKRKFIHSAQLGLIFLLALCGQSASALEEASRPARPNVILILVDDLGWQDVKCYDIDTPSPMETPNLDALARRGVQFWQAYSPAPTCAPSRAAILSGDHPARAQMTHVSGGRPPAPHHLNAWPMMSPWYSARMPAGTVTIAEALKAHGYTTGHSGKWHIAKNHHGYPQPKDQGFDYTRSSRGVQGRMSPDRLTGFATSQAGDPFRLDGNGMPFDQTHHDAMSFLRGNHNKPFFLYYATWLVHTPIVMRSEALLRKYENKLGVQLTPEHANSWKTDGQTNPFYCAMVEQLDYYLGQLFDFLEQTEDPRWPGHKLVENTYVIFTSDNGGMEGHSDEIITDNAPLLKGKISVMEGGTRVPLIVTGPKIPADVQTDVMVNGLDFYPTILSLSGSPVPNGKQFDGVDLASLLLADPTNPELIRTADGTVRDTMVWHFPNSAALESSIRVGDYKLVRNYQHLPKHVSELELYRLYDSTGGAQVRVDIEEANNLVASMPEKAEALNTKLTEMLTEMEASYPYWNPNFKNSLPNQNQVGELVSCQQQGDQVVIQYRENGAKVIRVNLIYTMNGGDNFEEWFRTPASLASAGQATVQLPKGTTHYFINLIDENNFLVSYPEIDEVKRRKAKQRHSEIALKVK